MDKINTQVSGEEASDGTAKQESMQSGNQTDVETHDQGIESVDNQGSEMTCGDFPSKTKGNPKGAPNFSEVNKCAPEGYPNAQNGSTQTSSEGKSAPKSDSSSGAKGAFVGAAAGAAGVFSAVPIIQAIGFGAGGIVADSIAAGMMSAAAIANGGGVAAGSTVAVLQSIGAVGAIGAGVVTAVVIGGAAIGFGISKLYTYATHSKETVEPTQQQTSESDSTIWYLGSMDDDGNVIISSHLTEENARVAYDNNTGVKLLYGGFIQIACCDGNMPEGNEKLIKIRIAMQKHGAVCGNFMH